MKRTGRPKGSINSPEVMKTLSESHKKNHAIRNVKTSEQPNPEDDDYHVNAGEGWILPRFDPCE